MADVPGTPELGEPRGDVFADLGRTSDIVAGLVLSSRACVKIINLSGCLLAMNDHGREVLEIDDFGAICGAQWSVLWPPAERERVAQSIENARRGQSTSFVAFCPTAKGTPRWWDVTVTPVRDHDGVITRILSCSYDVTELKAREEQLEATIMEQRRMLVSLAHQLDGEARRLAEARRHLTHTEKLRVVGQFVGSVVHDINNVLAVMQSAARLLRRRLSGASETDIVGHVEKSVEHGKRLVRRLLDFSRSGVALVEAFDPGAMLRADVELLRHLAGRKVSLTIDAQGEHSLILAERNRLQTVIFNLVANARDAMADGGSVVISLRNAPPGSRPPSVPAGDFVEIAVTDTGAGMPPELVARAGQPFFSTKGEGKGTGLGLSSAVELAELSGGKLVIDSTVGKGTKVALYLPRAAEGSSDVAVLDEAVSTESHGRATVLVVKVDAAARQHIAAILRRLGYVVLEASSEELALAAVLREVAIDLVITDVRLGAKSGQRLADRLRHDDPHLPVIFISPSSDVPAPAGEASLLRPVHPKALAAAVLAELGRTPGAVLSRSVARRATELAQSVDGTPDALAMRRWLQIVASTRRLPSMEEVADILSDGASQASVVEVCGSDADPEFRLADARATDDDGTSANQGQLSPHSAMLAAAFRTLASGMPTMDDGADGDGRKHPVLVLPVADDDSSVTHLVVLELRD